MLVIIVTRNVHVHVLMKAYTPEQMAKNVGKNQSNFSIIQGEHL